ncbi:alpha-tocopherol transfer protein-like [Clavelina lepadiformis]|uniref:alpha-tocopherol transfer protein-like n=1 Tax=Clavelina lepadiformis TaxID=159417 RepID=UPI0040431C89
MTARYECTLSPELLEKAVTELNEPRDNAERLKAIDELRNSYNAEKYGPLIRDDDGFILRFLRAKKFNQKKALTVLQNYHAIQKEFCELFIKVNNPIILQPLINSQVVLTLEGLAKDGASCLWVRMGLLDKNIDMYDLMAYSILVIEKLLESEACQINGLHDIEDLENFNIGVILKISPFALARMNSIWQDAMPLRFKSIHLLNEGKVYDVLFNLCKPFLKQKIIDRIHTHGSDVNGLHEFVDQAVLPPELGGTGPDGESTGKWWIEKLTEDWTKDTAL